MSEVDVALDLFLHWLTHAREQKFRVVERMEGGAIPTDGGTRLAVEARALLPTEDASWLRRRQQLEAALSEGVPGAYALWVPSGADLPKEEPALSEFIDLVRTSALRLGPWERSYVPRSIRLRLRKLSDEGGVVTVSGGLNPYWARFTDQVRGTYELDSRQLHRLPESEGDLEELLEAVIEAAKGMRAGEVAEIGTVDAWTVQRLDASGLAGVTPDSPGKEKAGLTVIGGPPGDPEEQGIAIRRNFKRILSEAGAKLREADAALRALVVIGYYARMEGEGATTALRGYDPASYAGIDFVCLAADGLVKPLIQPRTG